MKISELHLASLGLLSVYSPELEPAINLLNPLWLGLSFLSGHFLAISHHYGDAKKTLSL